jgi:phosphatidylglycerol:prolipoprotein diacylglycerol transferase|nr:prolipoprotein diacylglyceryl transferase family protein [Kofleriaceae bacterium]
MSALAANLPFFHLGAIDTGIIPIQSFGILVALGVLIGASLLRRYAEWHGISDDHIRGLLTWVMVTGFLGAHWFDVLAYQWDKMDEPWHWWPPHEIIEQPTIAGGQQIHNGFLWLPLRLWDGIASYGGFVGGAFGFAFYVWWKKLPARLMADVTLCGLLPAFTIGRMGCSVVSDHIGSAVAPDAWYSFLAMDYPTTGDDRLGPITELAAQHHDWIHNDHIFAWNLGLVELMYLIPVNIIVLYFAFRARKRVNAAFITVLTGLMYAPVRFFLDFLRPEESDPRHYGLTFAQWASILAFGIAVFVLGRIMRSGEAAKTVAPTSKEAQQKLKLVLKEAEQEDDDDEAEAGEAAADEPAAKKTKGKGKDKEPAVEDTVEDEHGMSLVEGAANVAYMAPRDVVAAVKAALDGDEHVRAAYWMPIRVKGEQLLVIGLDLDDTSEAHFKELAGKLDAWPVLLLDNKQLIDAARSFDRKLYPAESEAGLNAAKIDKPAARVFRDGADKAVKPKRDGELKLVMAAATTADAG